MKRLDETPPYGYGQFWKADKREPPGWPCPRCGEEFWEVNGATAVCGACNVIVTRLWVDGCWMGRFWESQYPGSLAAFVEERSETLRRLPP